MDLNQYIAYQMKYVQGFSSRAMKRQAFLKGVMVGILLSIATASIILLVKS